MFWKHFLQRKRSSALFTSDIPSVQILRTDVPAGSRIGIFAGNGDFPILLAEEAKVAGHVVCAACHVSETSPDLVEKVNAHTWIKLGQLGAAIQFFLSQKVEYIVFAGGIKRAKHFGNVAVDARGAALLMRLRSTKDDVVMRGVSDEFEKEGMAVLPCTVFMPSSITPLGVLEGGALSEDLEADVHVGISALKAMSGEDIGQLVVVKEGVVVAVEAVEGSNETIKRGGALAGPGAVVVKCAKVTQDMRFDVPTIGVETIRILTSAGIQVLALESGRSIILDRDRVLAEARAAGLTIVGIAPLVGETLASVE